MTVDDFCTIWSPRRIRFAVIENIHHFTNASREIRNAAKDSAFVDGWEVMLIAVLHEQIIDGTGVIFAGFKMISNLQPPS